jgi:hypothetical protein
VASLEEVRRIASLLPGVSEGEDRFGFSVTVRGKQKGFLWTWAERVHPKQPKVINNNVLAVVVPTALAKELLLASDPSIFFTEPHYDDFLAVLVRLEAITMGELEPLIIEAWKCKAPAAAVAAWCNG